jgi:Zn-dependent M16 (insulinase) family peptidase
VADAEAPLQYQGVVLNEMKGAYSSADQLNGRACQRAVFAGHEVYANDSGGDPRAIPRLTYAEFEAFHARHYHPANAQLFFYGDDALDARLAKADEYLSGFTAPAAPPPRVAVLPLRSAPYSVEEAYPVDEAEEAPTQFVSLNWLLNEAPLQPVEEVSWDVLNHLLLGTSAAELEKPLIASGLGAATIGGGYDGHLKQATFSVGLKGVAPGDEAAAGVEGCVLDTLGTLAREGFDDEAVMLLLRSCCAPPRRLPLAPSA